MNVRRFETGDDVARGLADAIANEIERGGARVISLSGGTTPEPAYAMLGRERMQSAFAALPITWVVGDERFVPPDSPESNVGMLRRTLFAGGLPAAHRLLDFRTTLGEPGDVAADFEKRWREYAIERIDCCILGMGDDGHTASLFPGTDALRVTGRVACANFVPRLDAWRLTTTFDVLRSAAKRFVAAAGEKKRPMLERVAAGEDLPIVTATQGEGETWWFVDRAAMPEI